MSININEVAPKSVSQKAATQSSSGPDGARQKAASPQPRRDTLSYVVRLFSRFLQSERQIFILGLLMLALEAATAIYEGYPLAYVIDFLTGERSALWTVQGLPAFVPQEMPTIVILTIGGIALVLLKNLGDSLAEIYFARIGQMLGYNIRRALYKHLQRLSIAFHDQRRSGDILTRITGDVSEIEDFINGSLSNLVGSIFMLVGTLAFIFYQSWQAALVALVIIPALTVASNYFAKRIKVAAKKQRASEGEVASSSQEMLGSIRVIQTYSRGDLELERFAELNQKNAKAGFNLAVLQAWFGGTVSIIGAVGSWGVIWLAVWLISSGSMSIGMMYLLTDLIKKMFKPTRKIIKEWNSVAKVYASVERIGELLDREPVVSNKPDAVLAPRFQGHIQFEHVNFSYPSNLEETDEEKTARLENRQALTDVNFEVEPGGVMALVGHTGAGKSTIIQLLPRLYDPSTGYVRIDGADIRDFTLESLRDQISVVLQESVLFVGTIAENIAYGRTDATREEIIQAAIQANAHGFIEKMPDGYDTVVSERGSNMSGGQRQRIAIARAFVRNTPILILDEPTTGLDPESAELVLMALRTLMKGKTTIIISHDLKLVRHADKTVVMKEGRIEQMGTHRELLETQGMYANLYIKQFGHVKSEDEEKEDAMYDLLQSPEFRHRWPTIYTAFDAEVMQGHLQSAFFGAENSDYTIVRCKPGKASYLADAGCVLRYALKLEQKSSGETHNALVLARIFPDHEEANIYLSQRLMPLAAKMVGRAEVAPFAKSPLGPVALIDELNMTLSVFPIDGELPALIAATDRQQMTDFFGEALPENEDSLKQVDDCTIEPGHYGRQHRCVLRYEVMGQDEQSEQTQQVVYGKVAADDRCKWVGTVLSSLHWRMQNVKTTRHFRIPRILGYESDMGLILLESIPGTPQISGLLKAQVEGNVDTSPNALTMEAALHDCAHVAVALHKTDIKMNNTRTFEDEVASLQELLAPVKEFSLALSMQLENSLRQVQAYAERTESMPLTLSHGDYTYTQLIFDETYCGLVDFDTIGRAEPALDLGQFLAYMRLSERKAQHNAEGEAIELAVDEYCEQFIQTYIHVARYTEAQAEQLRARVAAYEIISLMRIALHSWQKMKSSRLALAAGLVEERIDNLG